MNNASPNPLLEVHRQAEAEFQDWAGVEIVQTFGEPQAEYAAIRKGCAMMDLPQRGLLELTGKDRHSFINNLLTNQTWDKAAKTGVSPGRVVYSFLLNLKGRVAADVNVIELSDRTLLETESRFVHPLAALLDKYLFAEQVKVKPKLGELHEIALHGPGVAKILAAPVPDLMQCAGSRICDVDVNIWRDDAAGVPGVFVIAPADQVRAIWMNLIAQHNAAIGDARRELRPVGWAAFNATRIEAGRPMLGIDFDAAPIASAAPGSKEESNTGALPAETGRFDDAVSVTKGCYLGQEIVARMHARGQVARKVVGFRMADDALPIAGEKVFDSQDNVIGIVTSSTISPVLSNASIGLAAIKRPHFEVGTKLRIPAEAQIRDATVVATPFLKRATEPQV